MHCVPFVFDWWAQFNSDAPSCMNVGSCGLVEDSIWGGNMERNRIRALAPLKACWVKERLFRETSLVQGSVVALMWIMLASRVLQGQVPYKVMPVLDTPAKIEMDFKGFVGERLRANLEKWELRAPDANPALVRMFYDRDRAPDRNLLPWSGEFVGKYLCASILSYRILHDPRQKNMIERIAAEFMDSQDDDGYLGPFNRQNRLTGKNWDIWGHYWAMRALILYSQGFDSGGRWRRRTARRNCSSASFQRRTLRSPTTEATGR